MLLTINQVVKETSLSKSTIYRLLKTGNFLSRCVFPCAAAPGGQMMCAPGRHQNEF